MLKAYLTGLILKSGKERKKAGKPAFFRVVQAGLSDVYIFDENISV